jgi:hypothetical protein
MTLSERPYNGPNVPDHRAEGLTPAGRAALLQHFDALIAQHLRQIAQLERQKKQHAVT